MADIDNTAAALTAELGTTAGRVFDEIADLIQARPGTVIAGNVDGDLLLTGTAADEIRHRLGR